MKRNNRRDALKGFTLLEMVVVVAIIALLTLVLIPTMRGYHTRSRLNTANSNAKVIFNSLQTVCLEFDFAERSESTSVFYDTAKAGWFTVSSVHSNNFPTISFDSSNASISTTDLYDATGAQPALFINRFLRLFTGYMDVDFKAYVENYTVRAVACAESQSTAFIGAYPIRTSDREGKLSDGTVITSDGTLAGVDSNTLKVYSTSAWGTITYP